MPRSTNIYSKLLNEGFTSQQIHAAMHKHIMWQKAHKSLAYKIRRRIASLQILVGTALSMFKTQFAKKPKNPV